MKTVRIVLRTLWLAFVVVCMTACRNESFREKAVDLADGVHRPLRIGEHGTANYPRVDLDRETRVVCNAKAQGAGLNAVQLVAEIDLPPAARIEFAYGVDAAESFSVPIDLAVNLFVGGKPEQVFQTTLDGTAGDFGRWHEAVIDAGAWTGNARLEITTSSQISGLDTVDGRREATVHVGCPIVTRPGGGKPPVGVVLISLDTLRADRLGVYGYRRPTSPSIDRFFGAGGVVVDRVTSPASNTLRAHAGMLSGIQPAVCVDNWADPVYARMGAFPTLADVLRAHGFRTAAMTEDGYVSSRYFGLGAGFEVFTERTGSPGNVHVAGTIRETFDSGLAWLERHRDESFFLFLHTYQVHAPYRPARRYRSLFPTAPGASRPRIDSDLYDGEVAETDAAVGGLMERLRDMGLLGRTLVIVTADHGEEFGEHGGRYHGAHLCQEILHVPLLLHGESLLPKGVRRGGPMSLVDLPPTILGLLGIAVPDVMTGRSLADHIRKGDAVETLPLYSEGVALKSETYGADDPDWLSPALAVTRWPFRLVRQRTATGARFALYDLDTDPRERDDLLSKPGAPPAVTDDLRRSLDSFEADSTARAAELRKRLGIATVGQPAAAPLDKDRTERLRALGYLQ